MSARVRNLLAATAAALAAAALPVLAGDEAKPAPKKDEKPAARPDTKGSAAPSRAEAPAPLARPAPRSLAEAMRRLAAVKTSVDLREAPFADAVDFVRRVAGFNVIVSPALQQKGVEGIRPVTLRLEDAPVATLCDLLCKFTGTRLKLEQGVLQFTTPEDARGRPFLRIYAIGDVTMRLRNFPGPDINLHPSGAEFEPEPESDVENAWSDPQKIVDLLQRTVAEDTWDDEGVSISADERRLIVRQYAEVHAEVARLLALLRGSR